MIGLPRPARSASVSVAGIVWVLLAMGPDADAASDAVREAIRAGLPKYDSNVRASSPAKLSEPPPSDGAAAYGVKPNDVPASPTPPRTGETLAFPRMTVRARQDGKPEPALQLPRIVVRPPAKNLPPEEFETPAARDARLVKKHLNAFDRLWLNRFTLPLFGVTKEQRARAAEAVEQTARQLDEVATLLELAQKENGDTEEAKKLEELYRESFMSRPMGEVRRK